VLFCGFFFSYPLCPWFCPLILIGRETRIERRGEELGGGGEIPESNFFPFVSSLITATNKLQPASLNNKQPPFTSWGPAIYEPSAKFPDLQMSHNCRNCLQLAKPCQLLWTVWSNPTSPHLGLKWKHILIIFLCLKKSTKIPKLSL
jgi:hypothetical protein